MKKYSEPSFDVIGFDVADVTNISFSDGHEEPFNPNGAGEVGGENEEQEW